MPVRPMSFKPLVPREGFRLALIKPGAVDDVVILDFDAGLAPARRRASAHGYWVIAKPHGMWTSIAGHLAARKSRKFADEWYRPARLPPTLFRTFAAMHPTPQAIVAFANRHGMLGLDETVHVGSGEESEPWDIEQVSAWTLEILRMNWAIRLWEAIRLQEADAVAKIVSLERSRGRILFVGPAPFPRRTIDSDILRNERRRLQNELQFGHPSTARSIGEVATICLTLLVDSGMRDRISLQMIPDAETKQLHLTPVPTSLAGELWVQLARAITANKEIRACPNCGGYIEIVPPMTRRNRRYCSDACKSAAYRRRLEQGVRAES